MSISKGGQSVKPYVGSKEVKEAYVGSQLVYKSGLPYNYYFVGAENDYFINDNVKLMTNTNITKPAGKTTYKIASSYSQSGGRPLVGYFDLKNVAQFVGWLFKFTYFGEQNRSLEVYVDYITAGDQSIYSSTLELTSNSERIFQAPVPANCALIRIRMGGQLGTRYFDNIRFEEA